MKKKITLATALIILCCLVLVIPIVLLNLSSWSADEYIQASWYRDQGLEAFWRRILGWSPRPLSDLILYIYFGIVFYSKKTLVNLFLTLFWGFLGGSLYLGFRNLIQNTSSYLETNSNIVNSKDDNNKKSAIFYCATITPLLFSILLFVYFLFVENPIEIFYWPAGTAPYILSLIGIILINLNLIRISNSKHVSSLQIFNLVTFAAIALLSSEVGAVYSLLFSLCLLANIAVGSIKCIPREWSIFSENRSSRIQVCIVSLIIVTLSSIVLFVLKNSRVGKPELNSLASSITGDIHSSFVLALGRVIREMFLLNNTSFQVDSVLASISYSVALKLAFFFSVVLLGIQAKVSLKKSSEFMCCVLIIPLLATNWGMLAATYYQFGEVCCPRHLHFRAILTGLAIFLVGLVVASRLYKRLNSTNTTLISNSKQASFQSFLLTSNFSLVTIICLTLTLLINLQAGALKNDISNFREIYRTNQENWQTNLASSDSVGEYVNPHPTGFVMSLGMEPGIYSVSQENLSGHIKAYMMYFKKTKLSVYPSRQSN